MNSITRLIKHVMSKVTWFRLLLTKLGNAGHGETTVTSVAIISTQLVMFFVSIFCAYSKSTIFPSSKPSLPIQSIMNANY